MARKRSGRPIDGWLAIDKPLGMTSTQVVTTVRRCLGADKVGHGGTLDPLATGVLPIALGEGTKTVAYVMDGAKTYRWRVQWGEARSTDDREGTVIATSHIRPGRDQILAAIPQFLGDIQQVPPQFSAVKIEGKRAYDLARAEQPVDLKARIVRIESFELMGMPDADHADFEIRTGKGAYVRSLARDLALALGTVGHVALLRRTACGPFHEEEAISLEKIKEFGHSADEFVLPVATALDDIPALALTEAEARRLQAGQPVSLLRLASRDPLSTVPSDTTFRAMADGRLVALARIESGEIRPVRVFLTANRGVADVDHR